MTKTQEKNIAWFLPRPKPDHYKGGMPLHCEEWLIRLAKQIIKNEDPEILNLFCGMNKYGLRVDINEEVHPDILGDAHMISMYTGRTFDIVLADPPYSDEEGKKLYKCGKVNYKKWTLEAEEVLRPGGLLIVYHKYVMPNPNPEIFSVVKRVFIGTRTYHIPRVAIYFQKAIT